MVSIKFWRGKFSRPATGYECIAHALAFDRGVARGWPRLAVEDCSTLFCQVSVLIEGRLVWAHAVSGNE